MPFLKHFRSRSRLKVQPASDPVPRFTGQDLISQLPDGLLQSIFALVCPHSQDVTYQVSEQSLISDGCMLCDLRDLSGCAQVNRRWKLLADELFVRIDAVHYCELEEILTDRRKRKHADRNGNATDIPTIRLKLFERTVRQNRTLALKVMLLKLPYMTRETNKADLARTVSVLSNLRYVDLPEGFFCGDAAAHGLREELLASCPDIKMMKYVGGSEQAFESLADRRHWTGLEILELSRLAVEPTTVRYVLACLPRLQELKLVQIHSLNDTIFQPSAGIPDFPVLQKLTVEDAPSITCDGLLVYLRRPETRETLCFLSLHSTGALITKLAPVLWKAPHLRNLSITEVVSRSLPLEPIPPLRSISLQTLHYEVTSSDSVAPSSSRYGPADSYYAYLSGSLHANGLPALRKLYVRDTQFAENLTLLPPSPVFANRASSAAGAGQSGMPAGNEAPGLQQSLEVYTKGLDELDWVFTTVTPPDRSQQRRGSSSSPQPVSAVQASKGLGPQWGGEARKSVMVGNGLGGFLAVPVPDEEPVRRPVSMGSWRKNSNEGLREKKTRGDLWR